MMEENALSDNVPTPNDVDGDHKAAEQWRGTDFRGIRTLKESSNLEPYLEAEGWPK